MQISLEDRLTSNPQQIGLSVSDRFMGSGAQTGKGSNIQFIVEQPSRHRRLKGGRMEDGECVSLCLSCVLLLCHTATGGILMYLSFVQWDGSGAVSLPPPRWTANCNGSPEQLTIRPEWRWMWIGGRKGGETHVKREKKGKRRDVAGKCWGDAALPLLLSGLSTLFKYCERQSWLAILFYSQLNIALFPEMIRAGMDFSVTYNHVQVINAEQMTFCDGEWPAILAKWLA